MNKTRSIHQIVEEQVKRWELVKTERKKVIPFPVLTLSREPGSEGNLIAEALAEALGFDIFSQEIVQEMARNAHVNSRIVETLDERGLNVLEEWISHVIVDKHLWPDEYLKHLMKVVGTICKHGKAIIVGRGANFILPPKKIFRIRVVAPLKMRIYNYSKRFGMPETQAKTQILKLESERRAFVRKYFYSDIADPNNYDILINTENIEIERAVNIVRSAINY